MIDRKDDYIEGGRPVHRMSYCAFLDILGFSERIEQSYKDGSQDEVLRKFQAIFKGQLEKIKASASDSFLYFKSFSDNVLLAHPSHSWDMESEFGFILWSMQEYQLSMALEGFFIRGGLSVGPLYIDEDQVYGKALIEAYNLENKVATNPIIVLSDDVAKLVRGHLKFYADKEDAPQRRSVLVGADGRYFINYLDECVDDGDGELVLRYRYLFQHKERIEEALARYSNKPQVFAKFAWLASYHNYFCDLVSRCGGYHPNLKIDPGLAISSFSLL